MLFYIIYSDFLSFAFFFPELIFFSWTLRFPDVKFLNLLNHFYFCFFSEGIDVEATETLHHPTANRVKAPQRRPPSTVGPPAVGHPAVGHPAVGPNRDLVSNIQLLFLHVVKQFFCAISYIIILFS